MICLVALPVFLILSIFSVKYRILFKESFECLVSRVVFKPCKSSLDKRIKANLTGKLMNRTPRIAKFIYKYFELISWIFLILMVVSLYYSALGGYNYIVYGNCNGKDSTDFCIFNPLGSGNITCGSEHCEEFGCNCGENEANCTLENNYAACNGNCTCNKNVCGKV